MTQLFTLRKLVSAWNAITILSNQVAAGGGDAALAFWLSRQINVVRPVIEQLEVSSRKVAAEKKGKGEQEAELDKLMDETVELKFEQRPTTILDNILGLEANALGVCAFLFHSDDPQPK